MGCMPVQCGLVISTYSFISSYRTLLDEGAAVLFSPNICQDLVEYYFGVLRRSAKLKLLLIHLF